MSKEYTTKVIDLLNKPIIRDDRPHEWQNKMTDEQIQQWDKEAREFCIEEGTPNKFPDLNAAHLAKEIDTGILYDLFKLATPEQMKNIKTK